MAVKSLQRIIRYRVARWCAKSILRNRVILQPMMHRSMQAVGDMIWFDEAGTNDKVAYDPSRTRIASVKSTVFGRMAPGVPKRKRNHANNDKTPYLCNDGLYVVEGGNRIVRYSPVGDIC